MKVTLKVGVLVPITRVPGKGLEPLLLAEADFESAASANSATQAGMMNLMYKGLYRISRINCASFALCQFRHPGR